MATIHKLSTDNKNWRQIKSLVRFLERNNAAPGISPDLNPRDTKHPSANQRAPRACLTATQLFHKLIFFLTADSWQRYAVSMNEEIFSRNLFLALQGACYIQRQIDECYGKSLRTPIPVGDLASVLAETVTSFFAASPLTSLPMTTNRWLVCRTPFL